MRILEFKEIGSPPALTEAPIPAPLAGQIRIRVSATALNFADILMIEGKYQDMPPFPLVPGLEVAGIVDEVGRGVTGITEGTRVAAQCRGGGLAEYVVADAAQILQLPNAMNDVVGAAFQIAYGTSHLALARRGRLAKGETLAVLGAAGGVGLAAVQVGNALGAHVIAVARGEDRLAVAKSAGAQVLVDSNKTPDLRRALKSAGPLDVVFDAVGGSDGEAALRSIRPEGRHLLVGFASGELPTLRPNHMLVKNIDVIGVNWGGYSSFEPSAAAQSLEILVKWFCEGRIEPHISKVLTLDQAAEAFEILRNRQATGKIVITQ
ncbi:MAG: NADPH:quinone oxidoreductase family protein [Boseongicola sp.]